jgi:carboxypeptidase family protein
MFKRLTALAFAAFAAATLSGQESGSLSVTVHDSDGFRLAGVTLKSSPPIFTYPAAVTDVNGSYSFAAVPPGAYTVIATREGFREASGIVFVKAGKESTLDLSVSGVPIAEWPTADSRGASSGYTFAKRPVRTTKTITDDFSDADNRKLVADKLDWSMRSRTQGRKTSGWLTSLSWPQGTRNGYTIQSPPGRLDGPDLIPSSLTRWDTQSAIDSVSTAGGPRLDPEFWRYVDANISRPDVALSLDSAAEANGVVLDRNINAALRIEYLGAEQELLARGLSADTLRTVAPQVMSQYLSKVAHGEPTASLSELIFHSLGQTVKAAFSLSPTAVVWIAFEISPDHADYRVIIDHDEQQCSKSHPCHAAANLGLHHLIVQIANNTKPCDEWLLLRTTMKYYCPKR